MARRKNTIPNTKIGMKANIGLTQEAWLRSYYDRKRVLRIPPEILAANPDKHFCFLNMNKLQKSGMWHQHGYQLYRTDQDKEAMVTEKFTAQIDNYIHRNEMVLAYIPKEEYELRQMEREVARGKRSLKDVIMKSAALRDFAPHAEESEEELPFEFKKQPKTKLQVPEEGQLGG